MKTIPNLIQIFIVKKICVSLTIVIAINSIIQIINASAAVAYGTKLGLYAANSLNQNLDKILYPNGIFNIGTPPLPDTSFISSSLEDGDLNIPLIMLLKNVISLDILEIILILLLIFVIYYKYFSIYVLKFWVKLLNKIPNKSMVNFINSWMDKVNKIQNYNHKFFNIMFIIILILLLYIKFINLFVSIGIFNNIDDLVYVYNQLKPQN